MPVPADGQSSSGWQGQHGRQAVEHHAEALAGDFPPLSSVLQGPAVVRRFSPARTPSAGRRAQCRHAAECIRSGRDASIPPWTKTARFYRRAAGRKGRFFRNAPVSGLSARRWRPSGSKKCDHGRQDEQGRNGVTLALVVHEPGQAESERQRQTQQHQRPYKSQHRMASPRAPYHHQNDQRTEGRQDPQGRLTVVHERSSRQIILSTSALGASNRMNPRTSLRGAQRRSNLNPTIGDCFASLAMICLCSFCSRPSATQHLHDEGDRVSGQENEQRERPGDGQRHERQEPAPVSQHAGNAQAQSHQQTRQNERPYKGRERTASPRLHDEQRRRQCAEYHKSEHGHLAVPHGRRFYHIAGLCIKAIRSDAARRLVAWASRPVVRHIFAWLSPLFVCRLAAEGLRLTLSGYRRGEGDRPWFGVPPLGGS